MFGLERKGRYLISRQYPARPILGVGGIIVDEQDRVLLIQRGGEPLKGYWSIPGGVLETGEFLEDAIRREMLEETGLAVQPVQVITIFERIMRDSEGMAEYHYVIVDYLCHKLSGSPVAGSDAARIGWFARPDIPTLLLTEGAEQVIDAAYKILRNEAYQFRTTRI